MNRHADILCETNLEIVESDDKECSCENTNDVIDFNNAGFKVKNLVTKV